MCPTCSRSGQWHYSVALHTTRFGFVRPRYYGSGTNLMCDSCKFLVESSSDDRRSKQSECRWSKYRCIPVLANSIYCVLVDKGSR